MPKQAQDPDINSGRDDDYFVLHRDNEAFRSGANRRPVFDRSLGCQAIFFIPFFLAGLLLIAITFSEWQRYVALSTDFAFTRGRYVDSRIDNSDDSTTYYVTYEFAVDDKLYRIDESVNSETYRAVNQETPLEVRFVRSNPGEATIEPLRPALAIGLTAFTFCWNAFMVVFAGGSLRALFKQRQLGKRGRFLPGEVLECSGSTDSDGDHTVVVTYRFTSPQTSQVLEGQESALRNDLKQGPLPQPGAAVRVAYLSDKKYGVL